MVGKQLSVSVSVQANLEEASRAPENRRTGNRELKHDPRFSAARLALRFRRLRSWSRRGMLCRSWSRNRTGREGAGWR